VRLAELGEFGFIERIGRAVAPGAGVRLGIGDDCAALEPPAGELLLTTTDLLIEGVHFRREWTGLRALGRKSVSVNVSDIAAMGGAPRHLFLGLGVPAGVSVEELDAFVAGFLEAAALYGATLAGGDTCASPGPLLIAVTAQGAVPEGEMVRRGGARPGDDLWVSGTLGDSALALRLLQRGEAPEPFLAGRHHEPEARAGLGRALAQARLPTAMIDLSDGLLADLGHLLEASAAGALVEEAALPLSEPFRRALAAEPELVGLALSGGEDYELLFAAPPQRRGEVAAVAARCAIPLTRVGEVTPPDDGLSVKTRSGRLIHPRRAGYDHFARGGGEVGPMFASRGAMEP
jgi:thiamine-monophosphate kinase